MFAYFEHGFHLQMTRAEAEQCSHRGDCQDDVRRLIATPKMRRQLARLDKEAIRNELKQYGAWDSEELADDTANQERLVWIAAGNIKEESRKA